MIKPSLKCMLSFCGVEIKSLSSSERSFPSLKVAARASSVCSTPHSGESACHLSPGLPGPAEENLSVSGSREMEWGEERTCLQRAHLCILDGSVW